MADDREKKDLPGPAEESKRSIESVYADAQAKGGKVFEFDGLNIDSIKKLPKLPDTTEELSFFDN